jgi:hypothetical protein
VAKLLMLLLQDALPFAANANDKCKWLDRSKYSLPQWSIHPQGKSLCTSLYRSATVTPIDGPAVLEET